MENVIEQSLSLSSSGTPLTTSPRLIFSYSLAEVTFTGFTKSCYSEDRHVCIMSNPDHLGIMPLITAERSRMLHVYEKDKFYFHPTR